MSTSNSVTSGLDFASPESIMDPTNLTPPGDQYSLGCVMYYMLTGQLPFPDGSVAEKMMAHQMKEPTPISELAGDVSAELVAIVERLMKKVPEQRFANIKELIDVLKPLAGAPRVHAEIFAEPVHASAAERLNGAQQQVLPQQRHGSPTGARPPCPRLHPGQWPFRRVPASAPNRPRPGRTRAQR